MTCKMEGVQPKHKGLCSNLVQAEELPWRKEAELPGARKGSFAEQAALMEGRRQPEAASHRR